MRATHTLEVLSNTRKIDNLLDSSLLQHGLRTYSRSFKDLWRAESSRGYNDKLSGSYDLDLVGVRIRLESKIRCDLDPDRSFVSGTGFTQGSKRVMRHFPDVLENNSLGESACEDLQTSSLKVVV